MAIARRLARWTLWVIKAALAAVALAALVAWPWSWQHPSRVVVTRRTDVSGPARQLERVEIDFGIGEGRVSLGRGLETYVDRWADLQRMMTEAEPKGWHRSDGWAVLPAPWPASIGPVWWWYFHYSGEDGTEERRYASFPCWLLALVAGAWPLASAALFVRRRWRAARRPRQNRCRRCGYDLRATPAATGPTLALCPECGTPAAAAATAGGGT
jgi:hypothetical protein